MIRHPFDMLMELDTPNIRLDCAALHLAHDVYPELPVTRYIRVLDRIAEQVADRRPGLFATTRFQAMRQVIVEQHGITGNVDDYYDPENSYLNRVLDRGLGIPVSLAVVWIEVGRRLKWPVSGVGLPGRFLVRFDDPEQYVLVDPFDGGTTLDLDDCRSLVEDAFQGKIGFNPRHLEPVDTRAVLTRLLNTLRCIYLAYNNLDRLEAVLRRLIALQPHVGSHIQELAGLYTRRGDVRVAYGCLAAFLERIPESTDAPVVRGSMGRLEAALVARN